MPSEVEEPTYLVRMTTLVGVNDTVAGSNGFGEYVGPVADGLYISQK